MIKVKVTVSGRKRPRGAHNVSVQAAIEATHFYARELLNFAVLLTALAACTVAKT